MMFVLLIFYYLTLTQNNVGGQWALINKHQQGCQVTLLSFIIIKFTYAILVGLLVQFTIQKLVVLLFICMCDNRKQILKNSKLVFAKSNSELI